jgi:hypothetical protein
VLINVLYCSYVKTFIHNISAYHVIYVYFPVYDDTLNYYVVAYESATLKGVSKSATPATNFDINLTGGGGGGGEFFF